MLEAIFERARNEHRAAFIPYVMAGDPDIETTEAVLAALTAVGCDSIELGIPYGDPLADGPTIAAAGVRALDAQTSAADVLKLVRRFRENRGAPIILFTYFNPVLQYGPLAFARDAADAGASGVIVPDIALEEGEELRAALAKVELDMPLLVAPSTRKERAKRIAERTTGFLYVVSRLGVTGSATGPDGAALREQISMLRGITEKPLAVGFGVSTAAHVQAVARIADGIIAGSAIVDSYVGSRGAQAAARVREFVTPLFAATSRRVEIPSQ